MINNKRIRVMSTFFPGGRYEAYPTALAFVEPHKGQGFLRVWFSTSGCAWRVWSISYDAWRSAGPGEHGHWLPWGTLEEAQETHAWIHGGNK